MNTAVYDAMTGTHHGDYCETCLEHVLADNDHMALDLEDTDQGCWACEATAEGYGRWMTKAEVEAEQAAMQAAR